MLIHLQNVWILIKLGDSTSHVTFFASLPERAAASEEADDVDWHGIAGCVICWSGIFTDSKFSLNPDIWPFQIHKCI